MQLIVRGLLLLSAAATLASASVDPANASTMVVRDEYDRPHTFNVTHLYFRAGMQALGVQYRAGRCAWTSVAQTVAYWLNEYQLPAAIRCVTADDRPVDVVSAARIRDLLHQLMRQLADELSLRLASVDRDQYYAITQKLRFEPQRDYRGLLPVEVHFRSAPYPQSSFGELVTNRDTVWEMYDPAVYARYAGRPADLLYRFRHNFRHTLGLGHLPEPASIMYPTNVAGLAAVNPLDVQAVHQLLCDPSASILPRVDDAATTTGRKRGEQVVLLRPREREVGGGGDSR